MFLALFGTGDALFAQPAIEAANRPTIPREGYSNDFRAPAISDENPVSSTIEGVVTWLDTNRNLVVIQDGTTPRAFNMNLSKTTLVPGEKVVLEGVVSKMRTAFPDYPNGPDKSEIRRSFEAPTNLGNFYLARMQGFLRVPVTGQYTFWIASDDSSELWLDEDGSGRAQKICSVGTGNWTKPRQWTKFPSQQSHPILLKAGVPYYIEALDQQSSGRDCLAVAWRGPTIKRSVIQGRYLSPGNMHEVGGHSSNSTGQGVLWEYWTNFFLADLSRLEIVDPEIRILRPVRVLQSGRGNLPEPMKVRPGERLAGANDFRWMQLHGTVRFSSRTAGGLRLELSGEQASVQVMVKGNVSPALLPDDSLVQVRGVGELVPGFTHRRRLSTVWVNNPNNVVWLNTDGNWNRFKCLPAYLLKSCNPNLAPGQLIHLQGRVKTQEGKNLWLMQGNDTFRGYVSSNGVTWNASDSPIEFAMSNSVLVGFCVSSHQSNEVASAKFDHVQGLLCGLKSSDIGAPPIAGANTSDAESFTIRGSGSDIWSSSDQCYFAWEKSDGDAEYSARLAKFTAADTGAKVCLMIRQSLDSRSPWVAMVLMPSHKVGLQARREFGKQSSGALAYRKVNWIKLVRRRNVFRIHTRPGQTIHVGQRLDVLGILSWDHDFPVLDDIQLREIQSKDRQPGNEVLTRTVSGFQDVKIKDLKAESSKARLAGRLGRFRIHGVVTFNGRVDDEPVFVVQDESAGCLVRLPASRVGSFFRVGDLVEASGTIVEDDGTPNFVANGIFKVGVGQLPRPERLSFSSESDDRHYGQWMQIEGVAHSVNAKGELIVATRAVDLPVFGGGDSALQFSKLVDSLVRIRGVYWTNPAPRLLLPSARFVDIVQPAPKVPFAKPDFSAASIRALKVNAGLMHRMKIKGVVTCKRNGFFVLQDKTGGVLVQPAAGEVVRMGERVEAVGFPTASPSGTMLTEALVRRMGSAVMPDPVPLPLDTSSIDEWNCDLVNIEAVLLEQHSAHGVQYMDLQAGQRVFRATLPVTGGTLDTFAPGSLVRVTGIAQIKEAEPLRAGLDRTGKPLVASLDLLLRSTNDLVVLKRPPWWTWEYTAGTITLFCGGLFMAFIWIKTLRKRVEEKTDELRTTMVRLQKETQISATFAERDRLAGEIHDSIEQGLSAIMMQMDAAAKLVNQPQEVTRFLALAKNMAGFSRSEVQRAVWDMQSPLLENADLATALRRVAAEISIGETPRVMLETVGAARALPSSTEHHLLRIGQEAITNAVKHACPKTIWLRLNYETDWLTLTVEDDGCGFDPDAMQQRTAHFGLHGVSTRGRKINASVTISSKEGHGTRITVKVPLVRPTVT